ncbi:MAG: P22 phage major capsid protein family protein, partial [bacterium]|nr:P22 phage major capsid protein family protein [bacterium]
MATIVTTNLLSTIAQMGLATLREKIELIKRTNREYEKAISATTKGSTVNVVVPAPITAVSVTPGGVHPNDTVAVTPTVVPITLDQWYRAAFAFSDKQAAQVDRGIVPMQIAEAIRGLVFKMETDVWLNYKKFYGYSGVAATTPFATDISEFLTAEKLANDQLMPVDRRALLMNTAANANWKGLRRNFDRNFQDVGVETAWTPFVPTHTSGTNTGSDINGAHATVGVKTLTIHGGALGTFVVGDVFTIAGFTQQYV